MKVTAIFALLLTCALSAFGKEPTMRVLPWNGHRAAISLTFDDARPIHISIVAPALKAHHLRGTFFLIANRLRSSSEDTKAEPDWLRSSLSNANEWKEVAKQGNELGNHSMSHATLVGSSPSVLEAEITGGHESLEKRLKQPINTFAYPYSAVDEAARAVVVKNTFSARTGQAGKTPYLTIGSTIDWYAIPSQVVLFTNTPEDVEGWVDTDLQSQAWLILQIHGIGTPNTGYEPLPVASWDALLNKLVQAQDAGLWVAPFGEVSAYWRASEIFESASFVDNEKHWSLPNHFPRGEYIKIILKDATRVSQNGKSLLPNAGGVYLVSMDAGELQVTQ